MKRLYMYYGNNMQYEVKKVSDIRANDYVFAHRSNSSQDPVDMIAIYKACSKALDDGVFVFQPGEFDCGNRYLEAENLYDPDKPWIESDRVFPYYFRSTSPIKGRITWDEMNTGDFELRHIFVINTDFDGDLAAKIPDGTIIYIGGDHSRDQLGFSSPYRRHSVDWDLLLKMECKMKTSLKKRFSSCSCMHIDSQKGRDDYIVFCDQSPSPFWKRCSAWGRTIRNTASHVKYEGYKDYRDEPDEVRYAHGFSLVKLVGIIFLFFKVDAVFNASNTSSLGKNTKKDAKEMKGYFLEAGELESKLLLSVFEVLGGDMLQHHRSAINHLSGLMSSFMKLLRSSELMDTSNACPTRIYCYEVYDAHRRELMVVTMMKLADVSISRANSEGAWGGVVKSFTTFATENSSGIFQVGGNTPSRDEMFTFICDAKRGVLLCGCISIYHTDHTGDGASHFDTGSKDSFVCWK